MDVICAISTALAEGAVSVVRLSGEGAIEVAEKIFTPFSGKKLSQMDGYTCAYGIISEEGERVDDVIATVFRAPHSYTGEDVVEISCHGGVYVTKKIMRLCCENGARPAERGEFTKIAFLNGKLSLTQAESVMDLISAQGELTLRSANLAREGRLYAMTEEVRRRLTVLLGELSAWVDYPEEDLPEVEEETMSATLTKALAQVEMLIRSYDNGMLLKKGIPAAIVGKPNVGKSTLMNLLLGYERAIVTDIAGTTRDVLEETVRIGDVTLRLSDTAGIRSTTDEVERIGVELARKKLRESVLVIAVLDGTLPPDEEDMEIIGRSQGGILLINKSDAGVCEECREVCAGLDNVIEISAKNGSGVKQLERRINELYAHIGDDDSGIFVNERQKLCLDKAAAALRSAISAQRIGMTLDVVTISVSEAAAALAELSGERVTDTVVDEIFAKFCVGK